MTSSAVSAEAGIVSSAAAAVLGSREVSQSLFGRKALAISQLRQIVADVMPDADQEPVDPRALWNAEQFVRALPDDLPIPEFSVDPDGAIALDWILSRVRMLSVSVSTSEILAYAWLDGSDRGHGVCRFRTPVAPAALLSLIKAMAGDHPVALRIA